MDELDLLSVWMLEKAESYLEITSGSSGATALAKPSKTVRFATVPPSESRVWIISDYNAEMITAPSAPGVPVGNIRSWNTPRNSDGGRPHILEQERPD